MRGCNSGVTWLLGWSSLKTRVHPIGEKNHLKNEKKVSEHTFASIARVGNSGRLSKNMGNLMIFPFDVNKTLKNANTS